MVITVRNLLWLGVALLCLSVSAKDLAAYKVGDTAADDITATVPFDVVNADATAALKASRSADTPAIYRADTGMTNVIIAKFFSAFNEAHSNFCAALVSTYHQATIDNGMIESSDFGYFVTAFNVENKKFPVTVELAVDWARGDSGATLRDKWLASLLQAMSNHVRADKPPAGFIVRKTIRVIPVTSLDQVLSLTSVRQRSYFISTTNVPTITHLRNVYRGQFSQVDQPLAHVLANFIQPDCLPDVALTQESRDLATRQLVVSDHYDPGQLIIRQGQTINAQAKSALDALNEKLIPGALNQKIAAEHFNAIQEQQLAQQAQETAQAAQQRAQEAQEQAQSAHTAAQLAEQAQQQALSDRALAQSQAQQAQQEAQAAQLATAKIRQRDVWLVAALASVSILALFVLWRLIRQPRTTAVAVPAKLQRIEKPTPIPPAELAPYLAQTLKEAVVQGLAAQRAELLEAQRLAATEIAELVQRLDRLQAPMQDRLRAYQERIQELQKELSMRTEENRELLKMKIEMMRQQLETERTRVKLN
jgi:hypothetical protein